VRPRPGARPVAARDGLAEDVFRGVVRWPVTAAKFNFPPSTAWVTHGFSAQGMSQIEPRAQPLSRSARSTASRSRRSSVRGARRRVSTPVTTVCGIETDDRRRTGR
jgi:hypothetical protein